MDSPGPTKLSPWRLNRPETQNFIVGCILFCLPGIYLALTGLGAGGGGPDAAKIAVQVNAIVYGLFALFAPFVGGLINALGPRIILVLGGMGYPIYVGSLWYFDRAGNDWFPFLGGVCLGFSAPCLWTTASYIAFSYPDERHKGMFIAVQWALTALGGTVGASVAFGLSFHETASTGVSNSVYGAFVGIMCFAIILAIVFIVDPKKIVRDDGTHIAIFEEPTIRREYAHFVSLMTDWKVLCLVIPLFVAEMCLAVVSTLNSYYFDLRTRGLNNVLFEFIMIPTAVGLVVLLDGQFIKSRRTRGFLAISIIGIITAAACAGLTAWEKINGFAGVLPTSPDVDWTENNFAGGCVLYMIWGIVYAGYVIVVQWVVASFSNDPDKLAFYGGFSKGTSSLGLCVSFIFDAEDVTYFTQTIVQFVLYSIGSLVMLAVVVAFVKDTNYFDEENVFVPHYIEEEIAVEGRLPLRPDGTVAQVGKAASEEVVEKK